MCMLAKQLNWLGWAVLCTSCQEPKTSLTKFSSCDVLGFEDSWGQTGWLLVVAQEIEILALALLFIARPIMCVCLRFVIRRATCVWTRWIKMKRQNSNLVFTSAREARVLLRYQWQNFWHIVVGKISKITSVAVISTVCEDPVCRI